MKAFPASRYVVFFSIAVFGCFLDLATKSWIFDWLGMPGERRDKGLPDPSWIPGLTDVVGFQTSLNQGALFGMGQGMVAVFSALSVVAAVAILLWLFVGGAARDLLLTVALGLVTAGIFGNLYDRLGLPGLHWSDGGRVYAVRDWILVMIGDWPWPTFNLADSFLVCGAVLLGWHVVRQETGKHPDAKGRKRPAGQK
jgi:signal peptidase II